MRVALVEPDAEARRELVALLHGWGLAVAAFADPRMALLFVLGRQSELDGVLVNDAAGWPSWLRRRLEMLPVALPLLTYSGSHPEREASIAGGLPPIDWHAPRQGLALAGRDPGHQGASEAASGPSGTVAAKR